MFREMRRINQQLSMEENIRIIKSCNTAVLGVMGDGGYPYTVPVNCAYKDGKIYFHCSKTGHKLDAIKNCEKVSLCFVERDDILPEKMTTLFKSVIVFGRARILETEEEVIKAATAVGMRFTGDKEAVENEIAKALKGTGAVEITPEHITGKQAVELLNNN